MKPVYAKILADIEKAALALETDTIMALFAPDALVHTPFRPEPIQAWEGLAFVMDRFIKRLAWFEAIEAEQIAENQVSRDWKGGMRAADGQVFQIRVRTVFTFSPEDRVASVHYQFDLTTQRLFLLGRP